MLIYIGCCTFRTWIVSSKRFEASRHLSLSLYLPPSVAHGGAHFSMSSVFCVHSSKNMQFTVVAHTIFKIIIRLHTNKFRAVVRRMHPLLRSSLVEIFEMHWCWFGVPEKLRSANFIFGKRCEIIYWRKFIIIFHMIRFDYSPQLKRTLGFFLSIQISKSEVCIYNWIFFLLSRAHTNENHLKGKTVNENWNRFRYQNGNMNFLPERIEKNRDHAKCDKEEIKI